MPPSLLMFLFLTGLASAGPIVSIDLGSIEGFEVQGNQGNTAEVFLGIPFAKPPVGHLRFEKPIPTDPWKEVYQATALKSGCQTQVKEFAQGASEDCLYLNVIRPKTRSGPLPVMVWIHEGAFNFGSTALTGYQGFVNNFASNDVIVVSIQYRLGAFGFFSDGTSKMPGNMGSFDQALALKFIHENIGLFGGNKDEITVFGDSAGAASTSQLAVSPYSRDYFSRAIIMSGSIFSNWATGYSTPQHSIEMAEELGCTGSAMLDCMKNKSIEEIWDASVKVGYHTGTIDTVKFGPRIDGDFFPDHPSALIKSVTPKPTIIGTARREANFFTVLAAVPFFHSWAAPPSEYHTYNNTRMIRTIKDKVLYGDRFGDNAELAYDKLSGYFIGDGQNKDFSFYVDKTSEMFGEVLFTAPIGREIQQKVAVGTPVYAYIFDHFNDKIFPSHVPKSIRASPHLNEYHYLFDVPLLAQFDTDSGEEKQMKNHIVEAFVSFAKNGVPETNGAKWEPVKDIDNIKYLRFAPELAMGEEFFKKSIDFWSNLALDGFDIIDPIQHNKMFFKNPPGEL